MRNFHSDVGQVLGSASEEPGKRGPVCLSDRDIEARSALYLHQQLVCVDCTCSHLAIVVHQLYSASRSLYLIVKIAVEIIDRGENHVLEFLAGETLSFL